MDFTQKEKVTSARMATVSFFLDAIRAYLISSTLKSTIIAFLTRTEYASIDRQYPHLPLKALISDPAQDAWNIFRYHALSLVHKDNSKVVDEFISNCPAAFHPEKGIFILKTTDR